MPRNQAALMLSDPTLGQPLLACPVPLISIKNTYWRCSNLYDQKKFSSSMILPTRTLHQILNHPDSDSHRPK